MSSGFAQENLNIHTMNDVLLTWNSQRGFSVR
jgi:hypothetical protein